MTTQAESRRAFRIGFLQRCAEAGLTAKEAGHVAQQLAKQASWSETAMTAGKGLLSVLTSPARWAVLGPPAVAVAAGIAAGRGGRSIGPAALEEINDQEVIDLYQQQADEIRKEKKLREQLLRGT